MAARAYWKGYLKLSLVSCPVRLYAATTRTGRIQFHMLHKDTHNRIQMRPHDPERGEVDRSELVKGYEFEKDQYVIVEPDELEAIEIDSSKTIVIERFVDAPSIDPLYFDSGYFLAPDGPVAEEAYTVIHEAMRRKDKAALARVVLSGRERIVSLMLRERGFILNTLRWADEVRDAKPYFEDIGEADLDKEMLDLATQIIEQKSGPFEPGKFEDHYQAALLDLVKSKMRGKAPVIAKAPERGKVINLMDALKRSLEDDSAKRPPAASKQRAKKAASRDSSGGTKSGESATRRRKTG